MISALAVRPTRAFFFILFDKYVKIKEKQVFFFCLFHKQFMFKGINPVAGPAARVDYIPFFLIIRKCMA